MPLILEQINKTFHAQSIKNVLLRRRVQATQVLQDISLKAYPGEVLGLLGPNGAGKTTLLKIIASLIEPDSGRIMVDQHDINENPEQAKKQIGLVNTNDRSFYWRLTVRQNMEFFAALYNLNQNKTRTRIKNNLQTVGLNTKSDALFSTLSAGQRQKLAIARALLGNSDILLFDEPTNSLDPTSARGLLKFVRDELANHQQKTIIWCTHLLHEAETISDRFAFLHHGRILHLGQKAQLQQQLGLRPQYWLVSDQQLPDFDNQPFELISTEFKDGKYHSSVLIAEEDIPPLLNSLLTKGINLFEVQKSNQGIADIFDHLFAGGRP